jgi:DNA-directed RNA polymerase subunit E'/Rpb7
MFTLVEIEDTVRLPPDEWEDEIDSTKTQLNRKFCNKVRAFDVGNEEWDEADWRSIFVSDFG